MGQSDGSTVINQQHRRQQQAEHQLAVLQSPPAALAACAASCLSSGRSFCTSTSSRYSCSAEGCAATVSKDTVDHGDHSQVGHTKLLDWQAARR